MISSITKTTILILLNLILFIGTGNGQTKVNLESQGRRSNFSDYGATFPMQVGTALPGSCTAGQFYFKSDAPDGANLYACTVSGVWVIMVPPALPSTSGNANKVLGTNGSQAVVWTTLGGDVSGIPEALSVVKLRGRAIDSNTPVDSNVLKWNSSTNAWTPGSAGVANFATSFSGQTSLSILGTTHGLGTGNLHVSCYNNASPSTQIGPTSVQVNTANFDVTINFATSTSGRCVLNGSGGTAAVGGLSAGAGLVVTQSTSATSISVDTAVIPGYIKVSNVVTIPEILANTCSETTMPVLGAGIGDNLAVAWPNLPANAIGNIRISAIDTATIRLCNLSANPIVTFTDTFGVLIVRPL